ncbi:MAG: hypothetical protein MSA72_01515 [Lachnospiraceae bacterium]|nr:hypothetical protein [Lachnospiraceae bacterium]
MNIIKILLSIGLWFTVIEKRYTYLKLRDEVEQNEDTTRGKTQTVRNSFLKVLAMAVIYI